MNMVRGNAGVKSRDEMMELRVEEPYIPIPRRWTAVLPLDMCQLISQLIYHSAKADGGSFAINYASLSAELCCSERMLHKRLRWLNNAQTIELTVKITPKKGGRHFGSYTSCKFNYGNFELALSNLPPRCPKRATRCENTMKSSPGDPKRASRTGLPEKGALRKESPSGVPSVEEDQSGKNTKALPQSSRTPIAVRALCGQDIGTTLKFATLLEEEAEPTTPTTSRPRPANEEDDIIGLWPVEKLN